MKNVNKKSLIIFGYSEVLTLALVVNSKLDKVKEFNVIEDDNEDKFFKVVSNFISTNHALTMYFIVAAPEDLQLLGESYLMLRL